MDSSEHGFLAVDGRGIEELGEDVQIRCLQRARRKFVAGLVALVNRRPPAIQYHYVRITDMNIWANVSMHL